MPRFINKNNFYWVLFILITFFFVSLYLLLSITKYNNYQATGWDLGIYDQAVWHWSRFENPIISLRPEGLNSNLTDNFFLSMSLLGPFYWLWNDPRMLLIIQVLFVAVGGLGIFILAKKKTKNNLLGLVLVATLWLFIGTQRAFDFDFHPLVLVGSLFPWLILAYEKSRKMWFIILLLVVLGFKANVSISLIFLGLYILFVKKDIKWGLITILVSISWFIFAYYIAIPMLKTDKSISAGYEHWLYTSLGSNPQNALINSIKNPEILYKLFFDKEEKRQSLLYFFKSFGFIPLFSPGGIILLYPWLAQKYYSVGSHTWGLLYQYNFPIISIIIYSVILFTEKILSCYIRGVTKYIPIIFSVYIAIMFGVTLQQQDQPILKVFDKKFYQKNSKIKMLNNIVSTIPDESSIATQNHILPHITHRDKAYFIPWLYEMPDYIIFDSSVNDKYELIVDKLKYNINNRYIDFGKQIKDGKDRVYDYDKILKQDGIYLYKKTR